MVNSFIYSHSFNSFIFLAVLWYGCLLQRIIIKESIEYKVAQVNI